VSGSNSLLTINMVTREAVRLFRNSNWFLRTIGRQYDDEFARSGAKIGQQLRIRLPNDYILRTGPTAVPQGTNEQQTTLVLATQMGIDVSFSSADRAMSLDDYSRRILAPAVNVLAGGVAVQVMQNIEQSSNLVMNTDTSGAMISPTAGTWLAAGAVLDQNGAPRNDRFIVLDPLTQARTVTSLMGLFNPQAKISDQYIRGTMAVDTLGFDWGMDQTVLTHTTGAYGATPPTVAGANQTGANLTVTALGGPLHAGDVFTIAGVQSVNRVTKQSNNQLAQFTVTANVAGGATVIPIYPPIVPQGAGNVQVPFQTVVASPAAGAALVFATPSAFTYRKNFAYYAEAVTMATADLELPRGVHEAARETYDGISLRMITDYAVLSDQFITRLDILFGSLMVRPEWCVAVADVP
jgi:P22 coat protein - gene protein 5